MTGDASVRDGAAAATVLIVDDSRLARMAARRVVGRLRPDWRLLEAASVAEASLTMRDEMVDILLLDLNMPGVSGMELAREMRGMHPEMPIALVSANVQDDVTAAARSLGLAFVAKPVTEEAMSPFLGAATIRLRRAAAS